jgi:hypothetical protein
MAGLKDGISSGGGGADYTTGTFSGNMTLGDASGDAITVTGTATFAENITANGGLTLGAGDDLIGSATSDITMNTNKFTVAGASGNTVVAGTLAVTGAQTNTAGIQSAAVAITATVDGLTTGTITDGTTYCTVTSSVATKIVILPTPTPGNIVWVQVGANGCELRSDTPASVAINGGSGAGAESAIAANQLVRCVCTSATTWVCNNYAEDGTESKLEAASA